MKKKEIEALSFTGRKKGKDYYLTAGVYTFSDGVETLIVDVYGKKGAIRRYCFDGENYSTYLPTEKRWSARKIAPDGYYYAYVDFCGKYKRDWQKVTTVSAGAAKTITEFCGFQGDDAVDAMLELQKRIDGWKEDQSRARKEKETAEATEGMPKISQAFKDFAMNTMGENTFYYMQQGDDVFLTCSKCGKRDHVKGKMLVFGARKECFFCGCEVGHIVKETESTEHETKYTFTDVRMYKGGAALIQVDVTKRIHIAEPEKWDFEEIGAEVFFPKRKTQDIYWMERGEWSRITKKARDTGGGCFGRNKTITPKGGWAPEYASDILEAAGFKHTGFRYYGNDIQGYLKAWMKHPEIEYLARFNLREMVHAMINHPYAMKDLNKDARTFHEIFQIRPDRKKLLLREEGSLKLWAILKEEQKQGANWGENAIQFFQENIESYNQDRLFEILTQKMSAERLKNYLRKQMTRFGSVNRTLAEYYDYLNIIKEMGYSLEDQINLFPKNLEQKRNERVEERDREKNEDWGRRLDEEFENVKKNFKKLRKRFGYETEDFIIRPAESCLEIVREGETLHHCVGATKTYVSRHNTGKSYILFMRRKENPDTPYCTIEIGEDKTIWQWQQAYDTKPDEDIIQPVLDEYVKQLAKEGGK